MDIIQVFKHRHMWLDAVPMAELDGLPHALWNATVGCLDAILPQDYFHCVDVEVLLWNADYHHKTIESAGPALSTVDMAGGPPGS